MTTPTTTHDPFGARAPLGPGLPDVYRLDAVADQIDLRSSPVTVKILLENLLRNAGRGVVTAAGRGRVRDPVHAFPGSPPGLHRRSRRRRSRRDERRDGEPRRRPES